MAVMPMKKISIFGLNKNRKEVLELLQRKSCVELIDLEADENIFTKIDISSSKTTFENSLKSLENAVKILDNLVKPQTSAFAMFEGRKQITLDDFKNAEKNSANRLKIAKDIVLLDKDISDEKAEIIRNKVLIESLTPWKDLDISMRVRETENTMVFIGTIPAEYTEEGIKNHLATQLPEISSYHIEVINSSKQQTCIFVVCHKKVCGEVDSALRNIGFSLPVSPSKTAPVQKIIDLEEKIKISQEKIKTDIDKIISLANKREVLLLSFDYFTARLEKYDALTQISKSNSTFALSGFIPSENYDEIKQVFENNFTCHIEFENPSENEETPVKLKNNGFAAPMESVIESYSLPNKREFDPSTMTGIFYYFLFGLMLSDLAYGLIMVLGCGFVLLKFKNIEEGLKNSIKMFLYCGISTAFWGLMFGSFFGDVIEVVSSTFFGTEIATPALWFKPLNEPMTLLMFSLLLGIIHLFAGLALKIYIYVKEGRFLDALYDVIFWYFLVGGAIVYFMSMQMFADISGLGFTLPSSVGNIAGVIAIIGAVGIIFTAGRESKSPAIRFMKGLYGLYGVTSYLSDILSYSRLLALGLATGVIASVFNQMGAMGGNSFVGVILFIVVFIIGHALNIGLNLLGAYVHSNRLEFVEFFSKFYEGGGRKFKPFNANTKHFKLQK